MIPWEPSPHHPLRRLFAGLTEHAFFAHLGVTNTRLTDYLSTLLTRFIHFDTVYRLRDASGRPIHELVDMLLEAQRLPAGGRTQREYYRHIGDFALFWTGVYPESLERQRRRAVKDALVSYTVQGKRSYWITSQLEEAAQHAEEADLFRHLSEQFELCAVGLRKVREEWEELRRNTGPGPPLIY